MIRSLLLSSGDIKEVLAILLLEIPIVLLSLSIHELAHGYIAYKCGDGTARAFGRLTLNPIKHLDPIGTICMILLGFGWAKPVPINMRNFKKPRRDLVFVSLAGPISNLLLASVFSLLFVLFGVVSDIGLPMTETVLKVLEVVQLLMEIGVIINMSLCIFNLIPLPPLDGSKILMCLLPPNAAARYSRIERYTRFIFLGFVFLDYLAPVVTDILLIPISLPISVLSGSLYFCIEVLANLITTWIH